MSDDDRLEFATAQVDKLEQADWHVLDCDGMSWPDGHCCDAQRWLAQEVKAKREVISEYRECFDMTEPSGHGPDYYEGLWFTIWRTVPVPAS